jgi:ATP-dependent protease ClpP protease subunit
MSQTIQIHGEIIGSTAARVRRELQASGAAPVQVEIDSSGGNLRAALDIWLALRRHPGRVTTYAKQAASAASLVFMGGCERQMAPDGRLMIHLPHVATSELGSKDTTEVGALFADMETLTSALAAVYCEATGQGTIETWVEVMRRETWYTAQEAVDSGLAHAIVVEEGPAATFLAECRRYGYADDPIAQQHYKALRYLEGKSPPGEDAADARACHAAWDRQIQMRLRLRNARLARERRLRPANAWGN